MSEFISIFEYGTVVDAADFVSRAPATPLGYLASPGQTVRLSSYCRFNAPALPIRRHVFSQLSYECEAVHIFRVPDARFYGTPIFFATPEGRMVRESVTNLTFLMHSVDDVLAAARPRVRKFVRPLLTEEGLAETLPIVAGKYIVAASNYARNYYHWHVDLLMAVAAAKRLGILSEYKVLLNARDDYIMRSLQYFGVEAEDTVLLPTDEAVQYEEILFSTTLRNNGFRMNPVVGDVFDEIVSGLPKAAQRAGGRRLFVSRGTSDRRLLVNRAAVEAAFARAGFEVIDPGSLAYDDQVSLFHAAEVVVGEHGGGLGNIGFCKPGALVVELFNPLHNDLCYVGLAEVQALYHQIFVGEAMADPSASNEWRIDEQAAVRFVTDCIETWSRHRDNVQVAMRRRPKSAPPSPAGLI